MQDDEKRPENEPQNDVSDPRYVNRVFEKYMNTRIAQTERPDSEMCVGAVLVFKRGVDIDTVKLMLAHYFSNELESEVVREFNPDYGSPVWYVP